MKVKGKIIWIIIVIIIVLYLMKISDWNKIVIKNVSENVLSWIWWFAYLLWIYLLLNYN